MLRTSTSKSLAVVGFLLIALALPSSAFAAGPSGVPMPTGNLNGWKQIFTEDFDKDASLGNFPGSQYGSKWTVEKDGTPDTTHKGVQMPSKVLSARNGVLDWYLHSENGTPLVASALPKLVNASNAYQGITYGRFVTRFKITESAPRFSQVFLLWPDSENWPAHGEFDFPAGDLGGTLGATAIHANPNYQVEQFQSNYTFTSWHTATLEWSPGSARFYVDSDLIGSTTNQVASNPMHLVLMMETTETNGTPPADSTSTHMELDWLSVYSYSPGTPASPGNEGGGGATAVTARLTLKPGRCTRSKMTTVRGRIGLRFPAKARKRTVRLAGKKLRRFSNIDTTSLSNGAHKIAVGYNKPGHRRMHGCSWVNVAN